MIFSLCKPFLPDIKIDGSPIEFVKKYKYLGMTLAHCRKMLQENQYIESNIQLPMGGQ